MFIPKSLCKTKRLLLLAGCMVFTMPAMRAQSASAGPPCDLAADAPATPSLTYDVASIKPHKAGDGSLSFSSPPHSARFDITGMTMKNLIENAYGVNNYQVSGGPAWLESLRWDIAAKSDRSLDERLAKLSDCQAGNVKQHMLEALLADRIKLVTHRGTKEGSAYNLTVAKNGIKLQQSKPPAADEQGNQRGGGMETRNGRSGIELTAWQTPMSSLAYMLIGELHCPVIDKTGVTGIYDFKLQWSDESTVASDSPWPSIFTAMQEQLGLKLEPVKTQVETILIDHVEMPSEN
jgi:uncharacterized protein (TIGR03435 family)